MGSKHEDEAIVRQILNEVPMAAYYLSDSLDGGLEDFCLALADLVRAFTDRDTSEQFYENALDAFKDKVTRGNLDGHS